MVSTEPLARHIRRTLDSLPSQVAKLVYLASLRDSYTGRYLHDGWASLGSMQELDQSLRKSHSEVFDSVLALPVDGLCRQLHEHFTSLGGVVAETASRWRAMEPYREMLPDACSLIERELFLSQMRIALGILSVSPDLSVLAGPAA